MKSDGVLTQEVFEEGALKGMEIGHKEAETFTTKEELQAIADEHSLKMEVREETPIDNDPINKAAKYFKDSGLRMRQLVNEMSYEKLRIVFNALDQHPFYEAEPKFRVGSIEHEAYVIGLARQQAKGYMISTFVKYQEEQKKKQIQEQLLKASEDAETGISSQEGEEKNGVE